MHPQPLQTHSSPCQPSDRTDCKSILLFGTGALAGLGETQHCWPGPSSCLCTLLNFAPWHCPWHELGETESQEGKVPRAGTPGVPWQGVPRPSTATSCLSPTAAREGWMFGITSPSQTNHYGFTMLHFIAEFKIKMVICPVLYYLHYSIKNTILL